MAQERTVVYENNEIHYLLEQKQVKNLNLRVHKDCMVYVSANPDVPAEKVDDFVVSKGAYIRSAQRKFREMAQYAPQPKQYVSGETFYLLGRGVRLKVENSLRDAISSDGIYLHLCVKDTEDFTKKQKMVTRYLDEQCRSIFGEIILETYPVFQKYGVMHEFCHFVHPNHSKQFYAFLTMLMPDWKQRKETLDKSATFWL